MRAHSTSPLALVLSPHSVPFSIDKIRSKPIHFCWKIVTMVTSVRRVCLSPRTPPFHPMSPWDLTSSWQCLSPFPLTCRLPG